MQFPFNWREAFSCLRMITGRLVGRGGQCRRWMQFCTLSVFYPSFVFVSQGCICWPEFELSSRLALIQLSPSTLTVTRGHWPRWPKIQNVEIWCNSIFPRGCAVSQPPFHQDRLSLSPATYTNTLNKTIKFWLKSEDFISYHPHDYTTTILMLKSLGLIAWLIC